MAILRLSTAARNTLANALKTAIDAGAGAGTIKIYDGAQPATPQDAPVGGTNHLLATLAFGDPSFGSADAGVITANAIAQVNAVATGTAAWARIADSDGNTVLDVDVGASGATINMNTTALVINGPVLINSFTLTLPQ
jgi:hypothetical protein